MGKQLRTTKGRPATDKARNWNNDGEGPSTKLAAATETVQGDSMEERLREIFVNVLAVDESEVTMDSEFSGTLRGDSLDAVEIAESIDEELGVKIPDDYDLSKLRMFGDWVRYVLEPVESESEGDKE